MRRYLGALLGLCGVALLGPLSTTQALDSDWATRYAAKLGKTVHAKALPVRGSAIRRGHAVAVVHQSPEKVMAMVSDYPRYRQMFPYLRKAKVIARRGRNAMLYLEADVLKGAKRLWAQMRIYPRSQRGSTRILEGKMLQGNLDAMVARWELTPVQGGRSTLVSFDLYVDPDLPLPSSVFSNENRKAAKRTLQRLRSKLARDKKASLAQR